MNTPEKIEEIAAEAAVQIAKAISDVNGVAGTIMVKWPLTLTVIDSGYEKTFDFHYLTAKYMKSLPKK